MPWLCSESERSGTARHWMMETRTILYEGIPYPEYIAAWRETPEELAIRRETRQYVDEALATLNEKYRVVFVLRRHRGAFYPRDGRDLGNPAPGRSKSACSEPV